MSGYNWQPISRDTFWDSNAGAIVVPSNIFLLRDNSTIVVVGSEVGGRGTAGCGCCGNDWSNVIREYTHWAKIPGIEPDYHE